MKKILSVIIAAVMMFSLSGCGGSDTDNSSGDSSQTKTETVTKRNPVRSELYSNDDTYLAEVTYEYDSNGNMLSNTTTWVEDWGGDWEKDEYTYNANNNVLTKTSSRKDNDYKYTLVYEYDEGGKLTKTFSPDDPSYYIGYTYDEKGHLVKRANYDADGNESYPVEITCDEQGRVIQEKEVWESLGWTFLNTTTYDEKGNILKWEYSSNGEVMITHGYLYTEEGLLTRQDCSIESWKIEGYLLHFYE